MISSVLYLKWSWIWLGCRMPWESRWSRGGSSSIDWSVIAVLVTYSVLPSGDTRIPFGATIWFAEVTGVKTFSLISKRQTAVSKRCLGNLWPRTSRIKKVVKKM